MELQGRMSGHWDFPDDVSVRGYHILDSSNVRFVGWPAAGGMLVRFKNDTWYLYHGVSRQRAVACARAKSVGEYVAHVIKPTFKVQRLV